MQKRFTRHLNNNYVLLGILLLSALFRLAAALYLGDRVEPLPGTYDQVSYHNLALRVLDGHGFTFGEKWWPITEADAPTAHWSFLYTFYLLVVYAIFGPHPLVARLIQALVVGLLQPLLVYLIARRIFGRLVALATAALTTFYIYFIYYAATLMTEPFYITAILGGLYLSIRMVDYAAGTDTRRSRDTVFVLAIGLGLTLGIAILLRQLFLLVVPFLFLWIWWASRQRGGRWAIPALLVSVFLIIAMILPFTILNYARFDRFVLLNTNAGYAFFWANHPIYGTRFEPILPEDMGSYQSLIPSELRHLDEAALDQALLKRGVQFVLDDPGRYALLSLSRVPAYFMFWPSTESGLISNISRVFSFGLLLPFMLYGLLLTFLGRSTNASFNLFSPVFLLVLFVFIYAAIHLLSWALIRYRLPVDAVLLIFAGLAVVDLIQRFLAPGQTTHVQTRSTQTE
ncbi:MAG: glycosyltransferase family 39 protein [Anaerolineales bacterium]|jgi:4-amino-4-deoxy-L-arabinose transferase-like glycosyltransferase